MDFMCDQSADERPFRILTVIDLFSRECLAIEVGQSLPAQLVTDAMDRATWQYEIPETITLDNGAEFTSNHFDCWAYQRGIQLQFINPGRPVENAIIESFSGRLRDECLNVNWFLTFPEAKQTIEEWRLEYNEIRPHSNLSDSALAEYVAELLGLGA